MKMEQQLENTSALDGHDLTTYKFSELLDGYLAHMVRGPEETDWGRTRLGVHAQRLRDEMDKRIEGVK